MSVVVVLPVKRFDLAKRRLGDGGLRSSDRVALATGMLTDVLETLKLTANVDDVVVVTARAQRRGARPHLRRAGHPRRRRRRPQRGRRARRSPGRSTRAPSTSSSSPATCPPVSAAEIDELVRELSDGPEVVVIPDRHGTGTNALLLTPPT